MAITVPVHQVEGGGENRPQTSIAQKMAFLYFVENSFLIVEEMEKSICSQDSQIHIAIMVPIQKVQATPLAILH